MRFAAPTNSRIRPTPAEVALAVHAAERVGERAGVLVLAEQEDALVGDEDVVEDRPRLHEVVVGGDRHLDLVVGVVRLSPRATIRSPGASTGIAKDTA